CLCRYGSESEVIRRARSVVLCPEFFKSQVGAVVEGDVGGRPRVVVRRDFLEEGDEVNVLERRVMVFHVTITLGRSLVVVEGDAGRNHVQHRSAVMSQGAL